MTRAPAWLEQPQLEARQAVLSAARSALLDMASGRAPLPSATVAHSLGLSRAAYGVAAVAIKQALDEVNKALDASWRQGGGAHLGEGPADTFRALNRVPELRLIGVRARKRAEASSAGGGS